MSNYIPFLLIFSQDFVSIPIPSSVPPCCSPSLFSCSQGCSLSAIPISTEFIWECEHASWEALIQTGSCCCTFIGVNSYSSVFLLSLHLAFKHLKSELISLYIIFHSIDFKSNNNKMHYLNIGDGDKSIVDNCLI